MLGAEGTARVKAKGSQGPVGWKAGGASEELRWPGRRQVGAQRALEPQ